MSKKNQPKRLTNKDYDILKKHLSASFNTQVKFSCDAKGKGKITFPFNNEEELERLINIFDRIRMTIYKICSKFAFCKPVY